jgi:hypothetical protein
MKKCFYRCYLYLTEVKPLQQTTKRKKTPMTYQSEQWKDIGGFSNYQVSNTGRVYSKQLMRCLRPYGNGTRKNYQKVKLTSPDGTTHQIYLHKLVAQAFIRTPEPNEEVNHKDNDPYNNDRRNLEVITKKQNAAHKLLNRLFVIETVPPLHEQFFSFV